MVMMAMVMMLVMITVPDSHCRSWGPAHVPPSECFGIHVGYRTWTRMEVQLKEHALSTGLGYINTFSSGEGVFLFHYIQ